MELSRMTLEPTGRIVFLILLAHAAVLGGWWWMTHAELLTARSETPVLRWFSPKDVKASSAPPVSREKPAPQTPAQPVAIDVPAIAPIVVGKPKFELTLTHTTPDSPLPAAPPAVEMTGVDQAIVDAFKQNWVLPADLDMGGRPREALMDVVIGRDGGIVAYMLIKPSGQAQVDMSALRAAGLVKRIAMPLPAQFSGDSHEVQLHFHAE